MVDSLWFVVCVCVCFFFVFFFRNMGQGQAGLGAQHILLSQGFTSFRVFSAAYQSWLQNSLSEGLDPSLLSNHHLLNTPIPNNLEGAHILCYS